MNYIYRYCIRLVLVAVLLTSFLSCASTRVLQTVEEGVRISAGVYDFDGGLIDVVRGSPARELKFSSYLTNNELKSMRRARATSVFITHDLATNTFAIRPIFAGDKKHRFSSLRSFMITFHKKVIEIDDLRKLSSKEIWTMAFEPHKMSEKTKNLSVSDEILLINRLNGPFSVYMIMAPNRQDVMIEIGLN